MRRGALGVAALALVAGASLAAAQPAESPPGAGAHAGHPLDVPGHAGREGHEAAGGDEHHPDPSKTFNWVQHPSPFGAGSYKNKDQYGGPLGDGRLGPDGPPASAAHPEQPMSVPFFWVLLNFGILLFLFGWKGAPAIRQLAAKRSDEIKAALDEAARLRQQARDKLGEYSDRLRAAETEIDEMIRAMRSDAEEEKQRIIAAAEVQAAALRKDAEQRIAAEIERARGVLQREVVLAAAEVADRLLRDKTTPTDHANLVDTFLRGVDPARATPGSPR
jgi:F-type H+-transporting ATPase subunit b